MPPKESSRCKVNLFSLMNQKFLKKFSFLQRITTFAEIITQTMADRKEMFKKLTFQIAERLLYGVTWAVCVIVGGYLFYTFLQVFVGATYSIPSHSMMPELQPGDQIFVFKPFQGARLFDVDAAIEGNRVKMHRMPALLPIRRGDVMVFNYPYPEKEKPDSIGMDVMMYYCKRCIGQPGDTVEIIDGFYRVRGVEKGVGDTVQQRKFSRQLKSRGVRDLLREAHAYAAFPFSSELGWTIRDLGPFYVPRRDDTVAISRRTFLLYRRLIEWETEQKLTETISQQGDTAYLLGGRKIDGFRFGHDYYFAGGDRVSSSRDSRYWGLVPDDLVAGRAVMVWGTLDSEGWHPGRRFHFL